jgi:Ulp1 family protease
MIVDLAEEVSNRDETIVKLGTKSTTLEKENKVLKEQLNQMKCVAMNMNTALKAKQG